MGIWKRVHSIIRSNKKEQIQQMDANPFEDAAVGDIVSVDLDEYVISGKVSYFDRGYAPHRFAYYLQNGNHISCMMIEKSRTYEIYLCEFLEGALDNVNEVPTTIDVGELGTFELEHQRNDLTKTEGNTDFRNGDQLLWWKYFSQDDHYFCLQWQDGKFVAMLGMQTPQGDVKFLRSSSKH